MLDKEIPMSALLPEAPKPRKEMPPVKLDGDPDVVIEF